MDVMIILLVIIFFVLTTVVILRAQFVRRSVLERSRQQEEAQRHQMVTLINNMKDGIIGIDEEGIIRTYNAAALNILDTNDTLNGSKLNDVLQVKNADGRKVNVFSKLKSARRYDTDELFYYYGDEAIRLAITGRELKSGRTEGEKLDIDDGFIIILTDVTKRKNLDDERDEFISVVSHELRTPLTIAEGTLSNLQLMQKKGISSPAKFSASLDAAHDQVLFLSRMVNDLSTLSRAERGIADAPETINPKELLTAIYSEYLSQAHQVGLKFDLDLHHDLKPIHVSRLYITELLQNFVTNAIKYTKEGGVTLRAVQHKNVITFSVQDTGIGISKTDQKKIYDKFYRSEDYRTRETRGTGLGLYVCTKLARKMNTTIKLKSRINHGSEFSFDIEAKK